MSTTQPRAAKPGRFSFGLSHMMYAIVWIALGLVVIQRFGPFLLFFALTISPVALVAGVIAALVSRRSTQQEALLSVMAIAAERGMPLAPGVEAFSELCSGGFRLRSRGLSYLLESGVPFPEALANVPGLLPRRAVVLACVGWSEGSLGPALRDALAAETTRKTYRHAFLPKIGYLFGLLIFMQMIFSFIMYFITPKFEAIFADFGVVLPEVTQLTIQASHFLIGTPFLGLVILVELAVLIYVPFAYFGLVRWRPPLSDWFLRRRDTAAILRALAVTVEAERPITSGVNLLSRFYPVARVRRGLTRAGVLIENGVGWVDALRRRGLIGRTDADVLDAAQRVGNLPWAMRTLAEGHDRRIGYRLQAISQALLPLIVVGVGALVGFVAVSYFYPLITLIQSLAQ
jgi:type II secretory pathway component PulF